MRARSSASHGGCGASRDLTTGTQTVPYPAPGPAVPPNPDTGGFTSGHQASNPYPAPCDPYTGKRVAARVGRYEGAQFGAVAPGERN